MKSIKLLLVSFTITFIVLSDISPAFAKPLVKVQHLDISNTLSSTYNTINLIDTPPSKSTTQYSNNFFTGLIQEKPGALTEKNSKITMNVINKSNAFFNGAMVFSDKLNQFISYFTTPIKVNMAGQLESTPQKKIMKAKCTA